MAKAKEPEWEDKRVLNVRFKAIEDAAREMRLDHENFKLKIATDVGRVDGSVSGLASDIQSFKLAITSQIKELMDFVTRSNKEVHDAVGAVDDKLSQVLRNTSPVDAGRALEFGIKGAKKQEKSEERRDAAIDKTKYAIIILLLGLGVQQYIAMHSNNNNAQQILNQAETNQNEIKNLKQ